VVDTTAITSKGLLVMLSETDSTSNGLELLLSQAVTVKDRAKHSAVVIFPVWAKAFLITIFVIPSVRAISLCRQARFIPRLIESSLVAGL